MRPPEVASWERFVSKKAKSVRTTVRGGGSLEILSRATDNSARPRASAAQRAATPGLRFPARGVGDIPRIGLARGENCVLKKRQERQAGTRPMQETPRGARRRSEVRRRLGRVGEALCGAPAAGPAAGSANFSVCSKSQPNFRRQPAGRQSGSRRAGQKQGHAGGCRGRRGRMTQVPQAPYRGRMTPGTDDSQGLNDSGDLLTHAFRQPCGAFRAPHDHRSEPSDTNWMKRQASFSDSRGHGT